VSEAQQGLDPNALNNNAGAHANSAMLTAAMQRIKFIARIFAETGVKCLFQLVHALTLKHSRKAEMIRLRNQWVPVDPRQWKKRADMQISVGLGAGDKMQQIVFLEGVLQKQILALQAGLTSPPKVYNALKRLTQAGGFKDPNEFWDDPSTKPPMPPAPNPEVVKEQMKGQVAVQVEQMKGQVSLQQEQQRAQLKLQELRATLELQAANDARDAEREQIKAQYEAQLEAQRLEIDKWKTQVQAQVTQYTTDANNETKIQIAEMQARVQVHSQDQQAEAQDRQSAIQAQEADKGRMHDEKMADKGNEHAKEQAKEQAKAQPKQADSSKDIAALEKTVQEVIKGQKQLEETMRKPKKILRDKDGRVIGAAIED
jgi:chemotaxis protein histidine kinase CheA